MARHKFDKSSKWLLQRYGASVLHLGGARGVRSCRALHAEVVQPSKLPDGLLEVTFAGRKKPDHVLVEVATYPEKRVPDQALDDLMLAYLHLRKLPDLLVVVLHPKGRTRVEGGKEAHGPLQWSRLGATWKVVELWTLPADELLAANEVGVVPWVPLTSFTGTPEALLEKCGQRIEALAAPEDRPNLLAVSQVLAELRFKSPELLSLLGGRRVMKESPLLQQLFAEQAHDYILEALSARFGEVPSDVASAVRRIRREEKLKVLHHAAVVSLDLDTFREKLFS